jgi:uncharacterized protein (TIGR03067 family)
MARNSLRWIVALTVLILPAVGVRGQVSPADKAGRDRDRLQGTWVWLEARMAGDLWTAGQTATMSMTFKGDQVFPSADPADAATFQLDAARLPGTIDFIDKKGKIDHGIYKFEGEILTICMALADSKKPRPLAFESTRENEALLMVMKKPPAGK